MSWKVKSADYALSLSTEYRRLPKGPQPPKMERQMNVKRESWLTHSFNLVKFFLGHIRGKVQVFALVGPSGTGKSFRARIIADRFKIRFIIDDGILIKDKRIIAGRSAKREKAYLSAVKAAIFADLVHRYDVRNSLERNRCHRVLILGTSERMILKICLALGLPPPLKVIMINEIASAEEIRKASENRKLYGRHVIPVPAKEVRRTSPFIVTDEIKLWSSQGLLRSDRVYEKTLVRPVFSTGEALQVSDGILKQAIRNALEAYFPGTRLAWYKSSFNEGYELELTIAPPFLSDDATADEVAEPRKPNPTRMDDLSRLLSNHLEKQTGVKIRLCTIILRDQRHRKK